MKWIQQEKHFCLWSVANVIDKMITMLLLFVSLIKIDILNQLEKPCFQIKFTLHLNTFLSEFTEVINISRLVQNLSQSTVKLSWLIEGKHRLPTAVEDFPSRACQDSAGRLKLILNAPWADSLLPGQPDSEIRKNGKKDNRKKYCQSDKTSQVEFRRRTLNFITVIFIFNKSGS